MARPLSAVPDIDAPDSDYPAGRIRDDDPPTDGTPVTEILYGDIIQVFHKLMRLAGITYNNLPENETNTFQFIVALATYMRTLQATTSIKGTAELATDAEVQAGIDSQRVVTPAGLESKTATESRKGIAELATLTDTRQGLSNNTIVTPINFMQISKNRYFVASANNTTYTFDTYQYSLGNSFCYITGSNVTIKMPYPGNHQTYQLACQLRILNKSGGNATVKDYDGGPQYPTTIENNKYYIFEFTGSGWTCVHAGSIPIG